MGVDVDVYDENRLDEMERDLVDGPALRARYDAIWLGCFEGLAKVLPTQTTKALNEAVKAGSGFIHTGGDGSFHGGEGHAAVIEATSLDEILPVEVEGRGDLEYGAHGMDDTPATQNAIHEIGGGSDSAGAGASPESLELFRRFGLVGFNQVAARPGSRTVLSIAGEPLLVTGKYGAGKTAAFTGFTPPASDASALPIDQYLMAEPQTRAYFVLFADLLADVLPGTPQRTPGLLTAHEKLLFQTLKEQPKTELAVTKAAPMATDGGQARLRVRIENRGGYAHLVHMRVEWQRDGAKPYLTEMSDNDFELLPEESREIDLNWRSSSTNPQAAGTLIVNAVNAAEARLDF